MKNIRGHYRLWTFLLLIGLVLFLGGKAEAKPTWIKSTISAPKVVKTGDNINYGNYYSLKFSVKHTNNHPDGKIVTAIFDKTLKLWDAECSIKYTVSKINYTLRSSRVNKMELYPGQSYSLAYSIPLDKLFKNVSNWKDLNKNINTFKWSGKKKMSNGKMGFTWSYDYQVTTK